MDHLLGEDGAPPPGSVQWLHALMHFNAQHQTCSSLTEAYGEHKKTKLIQILLHLLTHTPNDAPPTLLPALLTALRLCSRDPVGLDAVGAPEVVRQPIHTQKLQILRTVLRLAGLVQGDQPSEEVAVEALKCLVNLQIKLKEATLKSLKENNCILGLLHLLEVTAVLSCVDDPISMHGLKMQEPSLCVAFCFT